MPSLSVQKILSGKSVGAVDYFIHEILDQRPVSLHILDVPVLGQLITLPGDLLHHIRKRILQLLLLDPADKRELESTVRLLQLRRLFYRHRLLHIIDFNIHAGRLPLLPYCPFPLIRPALLQTLLSLCVVFLLVFPSKKMLLCYRYYPEVRCYPLDSRLFLPDTLPDRCYRTFLRCPPA